MRWLLPLIISFSGLTGAYAYSTNDSTDLLILNRVIIIGNKKTLDQIIQRELTLKPGDSVIRHSLEKILVRDKNKIYNLRIFHTVNAQVLELPDHTFDLLIEVEERWFTFPVPIFELSDRNFNEWWQNYKHEWNRVNYGLRLYQYNFRGRNETIRLTAQFGFYRKFDFTYKIPYIDKKQKHGLQFFAGLMEPKNLSYKTIDHKLVFLRENKTIQKRFSLDITYTYRKSFYETHNISFDYDKGNVSDTISKLNPNYYKNNNTRQWFTSLSYLFISEHRDVIFYPLKGYQITAGIRQIGLGLGDPVNQTSVTVTAAFHKHLGREYYFSNYTVGYWSRTDKQPYTLFFGQGYKRTFVRGYEVYVIEGPMWALNKTTFKRKIFHHTYRLMAFPWEKFQHLPISIYLKAYADFGYAKNYPYYAEQVEPINTRFSNKLIAGTGLGLDFVTAYDGVLRVEYTLNRAGYHGFFLHIKKEF